MTLQFGANEFKRQFILPGNAGFFNANQVTKVGRKNELVREILRFAGDTQQRVKYWYGKPEVYIVEFTLFYSEKGERLPYVPSNDPSYFNSKKWQSGDMVDQCFACSAWERERRQGATFYSPEPCWGTLIVEYKVEYTEFKILYDLLDPKIRFTVEPNEILPVGYNTFDLEDVECNWNSQLKSGLEITPDYVQYTKDEADKVLVSTEKSPYTEANFKDEDAENYVDPAEFSEVLSLKLFNRVDFLPMSQAAIDLLVRTQIGKDSRRVVSTTFQIPEQVILGMGSGQDKTGKGLPALAVYEKRRRERIYPQGGSTNNYVEVDHVEEAIFLDMFGGIRREKLEDRKQSASAE